MTPKEKANELIEKFKPNAHDGYHELTGIDEQEQKESSIQSAIICVEEELEELGEGRKNAHDYWQEVKEELQNLWFISKTETDKEARYEEVNFKKSKIVAYEKLSKDFLTEFETEISETGNDFIRGLTTLKAKAFFYERLAEKRELKYLTPKASFLDWLLGRQKTVTIEVNVSEYFKTPPKVDGNKIFIVTEVKN